MELSALRPLSLGSRQDSAQDRSDRLMEAARGFESLFLTQVMKSARAASLGDGLLDGGGQDTTQGLLDQALGDAGAGQAGLGIAAAIHRQLSPGG